MSNNQYWCKAPTQEIAKEIMSKWAEHHNWLSNSGLKSVIQSCYDAYYSFDNGGFGIVKSVDGSSAKMKVQHLKSLIQRVHSLVTQAKLAYSPKAINSDASSQIQSDFAKGLLEYYESDKDMSQVVRDMVECGLISLDSYVYAPWDFSLGEQIRDGINTGDQTFKVLNRFDVASHPTLKDSPFFIVRESVNKFDLAAQYPKFEDAILSASSGNENERLVTPLDTNGDDEDIVHIYTLYHKRTKALSKGRQTVICNDEVLEDSALQYKEIPLVHFQPGKIQNTTAGDSPITSLISIQEAIDALYSAVTTNNLQYSRQNIWSLSSVQSEPLSEGFNLIVSQNKPEPIQLVASSPETYNLIQTLQGQQQLLSGVNDTARGAPEASLKSGNSLALMLSVAVQFADDTQKAYASAAAKLATIVIANLQQFANEPLLAFIGGNSRKASVRHFTSKDLSAIKKVSVDIGNPLTQNVAGRYELGQSLLQYGAVKDPTKLIEFLRTGQVDSLTEDSFKDTILIRLENESIMRGELPPVMVTDIHPQHVLEHKALANDPDARKNPSLMETLNQHILEHIQQMKGMDPDLAAILGLQPLPSQQMPQDLPPEGDVQVPEEAPEQPANPVNLPNLPKNTPPQFQ